MLSSSTGNLHPALDAGPTGGHIGDADGEMPVDHNFAEQGFHRGCLRDGGIGERTHISPDLREVRSQVWIPHRNHCGLSPAWFSSCCNSTPVASAIATLLSILPPDGTT